MNGSGAVGSRAAVHETFDVVDTANGCVGLRRWNSAGAGRDGGPAAGLPLVLLHGFTGSSESWRPLAQRWARERELLAIDLPGHGATRLDVEAGTHGNCAFAAVSWVIDAVLGGLGVARCALLGYSLGGRIALDHTLRRPERIAALVLESASPGIEDGAERAARRNADDELAAFVLRAGVPAFVDRWEQVPVLATQRNLPPELRAELRRIRLLCSAEGLAASLRLHGAGSMPYLGDRVREIRVPALAITGVLDAKYGAIARAMTIEIAGSRHVVVERAGHTVHLERSDELARHVEDFLRALPHDAGARAR